ncbi:MAG: acetyl-CoA carboxylase carboxyltransferase subunit alpha [Rickettsiales bacterium]|jgi:acetyl-CoA carboxylase carboxyl transferase subunit alpha|nr:acetyl-CoA carboxylase carboxyltransferase subunit alpha [Rickettsiales bacterium]
MLLLEFENIIAKIEAEIQEIENKISAVQDKGKKPTKETTDKLKTLRKNLQTELKKIYANLGAWDKQTVARHPDRPHAIDYITTLIHDFVELAGDRRFANDNTIIGGIGFMGDIPVIVIGQEKGKSIGEKQHRNFGMPKPEGYRKAIRLMNLASKMSLPIVTFVDTPGAYPGADAEARGQAEAIARSIQACLQSEQPIVSVVIGEGGSGGAIALASADSIIMLENSVYSTISPEGCAAILWKSSDAKIDAAKALRITADDLKKLGIIDIIVKEPIGGAHRNPKQAIESVGDAIYSELKRLLKIKNIRHSREEKFLNMTMNVGKK